MEFTNDPVDGEIIETEVGDTRKHGRSYIARITGTDPKFKYAREFVGTGYYEGKRGHKTTVQTSELKDFELLEIRGDGSWKNDARSFVIYDRNNSWGRGNLFKVSEADARVALGYILKGSPLPVAGKEGSPSIPGVIDPGFGPNHEEF